MTRLLPRRALGTALTGCVVAASALALSPASAETGARPGDHAHARARPALLPPPASGSVLLDEIFTGPVVSDPGFVPLDDACLTGATPSATGTAGSTAATSASAWTPSATTPTTPRTVATTPRTAATAAWRRRPRRSPAAARSPTR